LIVRVITYKERSHKRGQVYWRGCASGNDFGERF